MKHTPTPNPEQTPTHEVRGNRRRPSLRNRIVAGSLALTSGLGLFATTAGSAGAKESGKTDAKTTAVQERLPNKMEKKPQVMIPSLDNPQQAARALYNNYANYLNTGNEKFLQFFVPNMNSPIAVEARSRRVEIAAYQADSHSKFHLDYPTTKETADGSDSIRVVPELTTYPNGNKLTVDSTQEVYLDNRGIKPHETVRTRAEIILEEYELAHPVTNQMIRVPLISRHYDLGLPPVDPSQRSPLAPRF